MTTASRGSLLRILGVSFGVAVGVGAMIGAGILRTPSSIAGLVPDALFILVLWTLGGIHAGLGANIFAELATMLPQSGGGYVYVHRAFGNAVGLAVGWTQWLRQVAGISALSVSFAEFLALLWPAATKYTAALVVAMQVFIYAVNWLGLREGRTLQIATSLMKSLMLAVFVGAAIAIGAPDAAIPPPVITGALGWAAFVGAYQLVLGAYTGWDVPAYFAEENTRPSQSIPRALFAGVALTAALYIAVNVALLHAVGAGGMAATTLPFTTALDRFGGAVPSVLFALGAMISVVSCANAGVLAGPRILFALARDRLLPALFARVNKGGTPDFALVLMAAVSIAVALSGSFVFVFGLIGIINTLASVFIDASLFVLRVREPKLARPFRAVFYPFLPGLVLAVDAGLLVLFGATDWKGSIFAVVLSALCVPFGWLAKGRPGASEQ